MNRIGDILDQISPNPVQNVSQNDSKCLPEAMERTQTAPCWIWRDVRKRKAVAGPVRASPAILKLRDQDLVICNEILIQNLPLRP